MEATEPLPISALQHWSYCPRQCGLIHLEQAFEDNVHTLRGQAVHATVDLPGFEARAGVRSVRALALGSERLGLIGKADVVEFQPDGTPYPIEYKHGRTVKAKQGHDALQLAAQALCLEEMTGRAVPEGALFYASSRRRVRVAIDAPLRAAVTQAIDAIRAMLASARLPPPANDARCRACSLIDLCQPHALAARDTQRRSFASAIACRLADRRSTGNLWGRRGRPPSHRTVRSPPFGRDRAPAQRRPSRWSGRSPAPS